MISREVIIFYNKNFGLNLPSLLLRVIRDVYQAIMHASGYLMLHMSAVVLNGKAIAFMGNKGAGKSSLLLRFMKNGFGFLANDRVFVNIEERKIFSYPIACLILKDFMTDLPGCLLNSLSENGLMLNYHSDPNYDKVGFTPKELTNGFKVPWVHLSYLDKIYLIDSNSNTTSSSDLDEVGTEKRNVISNNVFTPNDPTYLFNWVNSSKIVSPIPNDIIDKLIENSMIGNFCFSWEGLNEFSHSDFSGMFSNSFN